MKNMREEEIKALDDRIQNELSRHMLEQFN
jgi:hypothetical protein